MPLIKDKDRYKKISARDRGRARLGESPDLPNKLTNNTQRERQEATDKSKSEAILDSQNTLKIFGITPKANEVINLFILEEGESLINAILTNKESSPIADIHWSLNKPEDLTFTNSGGVITEVEGGTTTRLLLKQFSARETVTFSQSLASIITGVREVGSVSKLSMFSNVSKKMYFYYVSSGNTIDITYGIEPS